MSIYNSRPISQWTLGDELQSNDVMIATDVSDLSMSPSGTTKKYAISTLQEFLVDSFSGNEIRTSHISSTADLDAVYVNGDDGVGATLTNSGVFGSLSLDGIPVQMGWRCLISFQSDAEENGVYTVTEVGDGTTPWVLTRADDYDGSALGEITQGDFNAVLFGNTNALSWFFLVSDSAPDVGVDPIVFQKQSAIISESWVNAITSPVNLAINTGYTTNTGAASDFVLPVTAPQGSYVTIHSFNDTGMTISQGAGQQIIFGTSQTTPGATGEINTTDTGACVKLRCMVANDVWQVESFVGTFNIV